MQMFYSKSTGGFYSADINGDAIPGDRVEITEETYASLFTALADGKIIQPDESGNPVSADPPPPTAEQILSRNTAERDKLLSSASRTFGPLQTALLLNMATDDEKAAAVQWVGYCRDVNAVDLTQAAPVWPTVPQTAA